MNNIEYRELLTQKHTAFGSFRGLLDALGGYHPSLICSDPEHGAERTDLADQYDAAQARRGDPRRALRS